VPLDEAAIHALSEMGYVLRSKDLRRWDQLWDGDGEAFFWRFLQTERRTRERADHFYPSLVSYAAECRRRSPTADPDLFSPMEKEQYRILQEKMTEFATRADMDILRNPHRIAILSVDRIGLPAAERIFGGLGSRAIILQTGEFPDWPDEERETEYLEPWWHASYWCTLHEPCEKYDLEMIERHLPAPEGITYWMMSEGIAWGGLAGGATHDLWSWDGSQATWINTVAIDTF
jgi:hypothetical protein